MAVYVDDMHLTELGRYGRMKMCHMLADSTEELLGMARRIGVNPKWIQKAGTEREHFDIATSKREIAVTRGAVEITMRQASAMVVRRRVTGELGHPDLAEQWHRDHLQSKAV
ncbi:MULTISPECIES: DUF4031 domain-containing protein [Ralstonia]|jgi:2,4-dienoyl-CoA reductase-like NADH-dependent reductase (Old Yellow Enzyme family)|uniref:DUF4031 domain-containing protein n=1 Tax=Ralstonia pickettii OR214 TaxID=1264675 RepID=R0DMW1_RALPI|nr:MULTISPECIES: DUF4031 domain-containing protein [Ralstonia]ENZ74948.1 hypothetical protein OR214_05111 [Ralstonia pickettii OR214]MBL4778444.1 DUF4031 domain-containing protein [Ralstonia sp.]